MTSDPPTLGPHHLAAALEELPLFPLPEVVLFPRALLPLHVFEPRYRAMLKDSITHHGALAIVQLTPDAAPASGDAQPPIARIAGAGLVIEHTPLPDGRSNIVLLGMHRVRLEELPFEGPYRRARATILEDDNEVVPERDVAALLQMATSFATEVKRRDPNFSFRLPEVPSPGALADLCAFHLVISGEVRQAVLEELDPYRRVKRVLEAISLQRLELQKPATTFAN